jgi:hypothetical protein
MWTRKLALGLRTRAEVVVGFAQSREFINVLDHDMLDLMCSPAVSARFGDQLDGVTGNDLLFGGLGANTFIFQQSSGGNQPVADIERWDTIALRGFGYASGADASASSRQQSGVQLSGYPDQLSQHHVGTGLCRYVCDLKPPRLPA